MIAKVEVSVDYDLAKISELAGQENPKKRYYNAGFLCVEGVTQEALDQALADYDHSATVRERLEASLAAYRDQKATVYTYKGVDMKLSDGARADLSALYFQCLINTAIPDSQVMAKWQEDGFDTLNITAGDLRSDGHLFAQHRQKCFAAADAIRGNTYDTIGELEAAFNAAYNAN